MKLYDFLSSVISIMVQYRQQQQYRRRRGG